MNMPNTQKGLSLVSWLVVLAGVVFAANLAFKIVPHYLDYDALNQIILNAQAEMGQEEADLRTPEDLQRYVQRGLQVNGINDIDLKQALKIQEESGWFHVVLRYENREPLAYNLSLVAHFEKEYQIKVP